MQKDRKSPAAAGLSFGSTLSRGNLGMWRTFLAGKTLVMDDDFSAVVFLSLTGLDLSFWLLARGFFGPIAM